MYAGAALGSEFCYCHTCRVDSPHALTLPLMPLTFPCGGWKALQYNRREDEWGVLTVSCAKERQYRAQGA